MDLLKYWIYIEILKYWVLKILKYCKYWNIEILYILKYWEYWNINNWNILYIEISRILKNGFIEILNIYRYIDILSFKNIEILIYIEF